jgi:hypothetical protein
MNPEIAHFAWRNARYDDGGESPANGNIALTDLDDPCPEAPADAPVLYGQIGYENSLIDRAVGKRWRDLQKNDPVVYHITNGG